MKKPNQRRLRFIAEYLANPNARQAAVKAGYPWGKGELAGAADPRCWQAEMWGALRAWLRTGAIADDAELKAPSMATTCATRFSSRPRTT